MRRNGGGDGVGGVDRVTRRRILLTSGSFGDSTLPISSPIPLLCSELSLAKVFEASMRLWSL